MQVSALFLVVCGLAGAVTGQTPCSEANRSANLPACLRAIGSLAQETSAFWFGSDFSQNCPQGHDPEELECYFAPGGSSAQSISSLMFARATFDPSTLDRYLDITYTSPPGTYMGCNNVFRFDDTTTFTLDPLSSETHAAWTARNLPEMTWPASPGQLFSLLVYDVAHGISQGLYVNIDGNDVANSEVPWPYRGLRGPARHGSVYVFVLFSQSQRITVRPPFDSLSLGQIFNITEFQEVHGLSDPVAMNLIRISADAFAVEFHRSMGFIDYCPSLISEAALHQNRPWLQDAHNLEVNLNLTYHSRPLGYLSCCKSLYYPGGTASLNPLGNGRMEAVAVREKPIVQLSMARFEFNPSTSFAGKMYTLIMMDPDVPVPQAATNERPFLHWLVINIPDGMVDMGEVVREYAGSGPPTDTPSRYYFVLYEQERNVSADAFLQYTATACNPMFQNRCLFDVSGFASANGMRLVGATWYTCQRDDFVRYREIMRGIPEAEVCSEVPGYVEGCLKSGGSISAYFVETLLLIVAVTVYLL